MLEWFKDFANDRLVPFVIDLVFAVLILIVGFTLVKYLIKILKKGKGFSKLEVNTQSFLLNFISVALKVIIVLTAVMVIGVPESSVIAILGSCGLALGLALQGGLSNIAGGIIIMFSKPFSIGDYIEAGTACGVVKDIGIYYTKLTTVDNKDISVPNSTLANSTINNLSAEKIRRVDFDFNVSYTTDIDLARKVLLATSAVNDLIKKDPAPRVFVAAHADSAIVLKLIVWCDSADYWTVYYDMWEDVKKSFDKFNIEIPYRYMNVVVNNKEI